MSVEYGYSSFSASFGSNTTVYGNEIIPNENITITGLRGRTYNTAKTGSIRIGTSDGTILKTVSGVNFTASGGTGEWIDALFDSSIELTAGVTYIIQMVIDSNDGNIAYTQNSGNISINSKITNSGAARYGSFPGTRENGVWVGVDLIIDTTPPTPPPPPTGTFNIHLMNNTDELNKITKNPTTVRTLTGTLREETDIVDPEINIEFDGTLRDCNYMHIPELNRYYFITKIESIRNKVWRIYAHCDVLKTYSEGILGTECVVARSENRYNLYLNDAMFKVYANPRLQIANFPNKFSGESYVLVMSGANYTTGT